MEIFNLYCIILDNNWIMQYNYVNIRKGGTMTVRCVIGVVYLDGTWRVNVYNKEPDGTDIAKRLLSAVESISTVVHAWVISIEDVSENYISKEDNLYDKYR